MLLEGASGPLYSIGFDGNTLIWGDDRNAQYQDDIYIYSINPAAGNNINPAVLMYLLN